MSSGYVVAATAAADADEAGLGPWRLVTTVLAYALPGLFILLPLVLFLVQSFFYVEHGDIVRALTLRNYVRFFEDAAFVPVFFRTCALSLGVAVICVLFAYPVAYLLASL